GCGHGVAAILLARAYPQASVHGYDFHDRSIQVARQRADQVGLGGRIRFEPLDATSYPADGFDLICMLDTLHDLGAPAAAPARTWARSVTRCCWWSWRWRPRSMA